MGLRLRKISLNHRARDLGRQHRIPRTKTDTHDVRGAHLRDRQRISEVGGDTVMILSVQISRRRRTDPQILQCLAQHCCGALHQPLRDAVFFQIGIEFRKLRDRKLVDDNLHDVL